jgi:hypothetical protein
LLAGVEQEGRGVLRESEDRTKRNREGPLPTFEGFLISPLPLALDTTHTRNDDWSKTRRKKKPTKKTHNLRKVENLKAKSKGL